MSLHRKFETLVRGLDKEALDELGRLVASEISRNAKEAFRIDEIHPGMTAADKERAALEIAQVLKEQQ
jgi:hypothetical protein